MKAFKTVLVVSAFLFSTSASALVLDFEGFGAGTIIDDEYFTTFGVTISAMGVGSAPDVAVVFDSNNPTGGDSDLMAPFAPGPGNPFGPSSPGNLLILQENGPCTPTMCPDPDDQGANPAGTISFVFSDPVLIESLDFFDIEGSEPGDVVLFNAAGGVLATFPIPGTDGDLQWQRLFMNVGNVAAVDINMGGSGAIDNLQFAVPLPAGLPLLLSALGLLGLNRRRS